MIKFKIYKMIGKPKDFHAWHLPILWIGARKGEFSLTILGICFAVYWFKNKRHDT